MGNAILKKVLAFALSLTLVFTMMPLVPGAVRAAEAVDNVVSELNLTYDKDVIDLNTAWTEGEVQNRIRNTINTTTEGVTVNFSNSWLMYKVEDVGFRGISSGENFVKTDQIYYIEYGLQLSDDYQWADGVSEEDFSGLTVKVNGVDKTADVAEFSFNKTSKMLNVTVSIGKASDEPLVKSVTINGGNVSIAKGGSKTFTGKVDGTVSNKAILWTLEGAASKNTKIVTELDKDKGITRGVLTIGEDETAETVTVKAAAAADPTKYATVTVTITEGIPTIDAVTVTPGNTELLQGASKKFNVAVTGTQADKSVTWSVENAECDNTKIDQNGNLTIGSDETAETITVKATANQDKTKSGTVTITVIPAIRITELNLTCDFNAIDLNADSTEGEVQKRIRDTINTTTEDVVVNTSNSWLMYKLEGDNFSGVGSGENFVNADRIYYIQYALQIPEGYLWAYGVSEGDYSGLTVKVNGVDKTADVAGFSANASSGMLYVTVPIGKAELVDIGREEVALSTTSYIYDGTPKTPEVKIEGLEQGVDYTVSYFDNTNAGTATVTVEGMGDYTGTVNKTFTISKQPYSSKFKITLSTANYTYNGYAKKPTVTVYNAKGKKLINGTDYSVTYASGRTKIGKYKVTVNFKGNYSGSKALYFEIGPKNPSSVKTALYGYDDVKVSWSKVSGASGYKVYYKKSSASSWTLLKTTTATSYKKANLSDGVKYDFKVVAYKKVNGNACENAGKTSGIYTLKKVAGVKAAKSGSKVKVSWTNINGETGYQISQATSKSKTNVVATYKTTSGKYKTVSAKKGKTYYYKVRAYKVVDGKKIFGPWSSAVKYKR